MRAARKCACTKYAYEPHQIVNRMCQRPRGAGAACRVIADLAENPCIATGLGLKLRQGWGAAWRRGVARATGG
jgi:hypothetical protein